MIEFQNVNFRYTESVVEGGLSEINLTISDGQVVLLCGKSGCGKTTLTRLINGLIPNFYEGDLSGAVRLDGKNISELPLYETAKYVGSVFQNPRSQFFTLNQPSSLRFGCENQVLPKDEIVHRVENTAKQLDMQDSLEKIFFTLSGGEKQKIACASVAASDPSVIVLDEPSSNLDIAATADLRRAIQLRKSARENNYIAEHLPVLSKRLYCDRVLYMEHGQIIFDWTERDALSLTIEKQHELGAASF